MDMTQTKKIRILVEFDFLIDLDIAMYNYIKDNYNNPDYINQDIININNKTTIMEMLINRDNINPLEILFNDSIDVADLYYDIYNNHMNELAKYAMPYDTYALMITFIKSLGDVDITVLCESEEQKSIINIFSAFFKDKIKISTRENINANSYDVFYIKYYVNILKYGEVNGKNIYIANAKYNMEKDKSSTPDISVSAVVGYTNKIHLMDLYKKIRVKNE